MRLRSGREGFLRSRRALAAGLGVVALYVALAVWSGHLSPLARGPLLDGLGTVNYRWVNPPSDLASTNQQPSSGSFPLKLGPNGVKGQPVFTSDNQVTVIVLTGSIASRPGQRSVDVTIDPIDPATLTAPGQGLSSVGNAYRIQGTYRPSGDRVITLDEPLDVFLVYPALSALHATSHELLYSEDGRRWDPIQSTDSAQAQQVEGNVAGFGYMMVGGLVSSATASGAENGGANTPATILLVIAGCALLIGIGLLLRSRKV